MSDILYAAGDPTGYALIPEPTDKERRFCQKKGIDIVEAGIEDLLAAAGRETSVPEETALKEAALEVGC